MIFGINLPMEQFEALKKVANTKGFKSVELYIKKLIDIDTAKGPSGVMEIQAKEDNDG